MHEIPEWMPRVMEEIEEILMLKTQSYLEVDSILSLIVFSTTTKIVVGSLGSSGQGGLCPFSTCLLFPHCISSCSNLWPEAVLISGKKGLLVFPFDLSSPHSTIVRE